MHSIGPIRQTGPIDLRDDAHSEKQPLRELGMLKGRFAIQVPNPVPETKFRLAQPNLDPPVFLAAVFITIGSDWQVLAVSIHHRRGYASHL
jgi:hypothetical protein